MAQNSIVPRSQEDFITQVSDKIGRRDKKKLSQEFKRTENRILGVLSHLDRAIRRAVSHEPANSGLLRNRSGDVPERIWHKPGNE